MDRKKSKKIRNARIIATNIFMTISVIVIVFVLIFAAQGYTINRSGEFEQSGLVQIRSNPSGATVRIDGETQFSHTEINKMLRATTHNIIISKDGYDTWRTDIDVESGLLTRIEWVRLFPLESKPEDTLKFDNLRFAIFSSNRKQLLTYEYGDKNLKLANIQGAQPKTTKIPLASFIAAAEDEELNKEIDFYSWNDTSNHVILRQHQAEEADQWILVNLDAPEKSINLSQKLGSNIAQILFANDAATKFWILDDQQNLYSYETNSQNVEVPTALAKSVVKIANNKDTIAYMANETDETPGNTSSNIYILKDGETSPTLIESLNSANDISLAMGTYWGSEWLAYNSGNLLKIVAGKYPSANKTEKTLSTILKEELSFTPSFASTNQAQRLIVLADAQNYFTYDFENKTSDLFSSDSDIAKINWLDDFLIWQKHDNKIIVRDFNGQNRRELISEVNNDMPAIITSNNKWLYYFDREVEKIESTDLDPTDESGETDAVNQPLEVHYTLKREALQL